MRSFLLAATLLALGTACQSPVRKENIQHSRIWVVQPGRNIWSFQRVAALTTADGRSRAVNSHLSQQLKAGEALVFEDGTRVTFDGTILRVNMEPLTSTNAVLDRDGSLHRGSFIRTFE